MCGRAITGEEQEEFSFATPLVVVKLDTVHVNEMLGVGRGVLLSTSDTCMAGQYHQRDYREWSLHPDGRYNMPRGCLLPQHLMHQRHRDRPLPHRRGHALDVASPHVADREDSGQAGFEQEGAAGEGPAGGGQVLG